jgi:alpha-mannosidase
VEEPRPEVPQRAFTDVTDGKLGLTVAARGLPEVEALRRAEGKAEIALTLLRCVGWLSRDDFSTRKGHAGPPSVATPGAQMPGKWEFDYALIPHAGSNPQPAWREAYAFQAPLRAVSATLHDGSLANCASLLSVEPSTFVVSAVKESEDGTGWVVRGVNLVDGEITVCIRPWRRFGSAWRANLAEDALKPLSLAEDGSTSFTAGGHEIVTVRFKEDLTG